MKDTFMSQERRRYFRINDTVGLSYKVVSKGDNQAQSDTQQKVNQPYLNKQDQQIVDLIKKIANKQPEVAAVMALFNQKLERLSNLMTLDGIRLDSISMQLKEVNISACGIAFYHSSPVELNNILELEITLLPDDQILKTQGRVVSCDPVDKEAKVEKETELDDTFYIRVDFYAMDGPSQEKLIQHIVKNQVIT